MKVTIQFEAQLRQAAGVSAKDLELPDGSSINDALRQAADSAAAELRSRLLTDSGELQSALLIFVNEQPVAAASVSEHLLHDGDILLLLPPISGG
ncbi:MAG: MoaD/ThiS family protein [Fuerstiella sp.]